MNNWETLERSTSSSRAGGWTGAWDGLTLFVKEKKENELVNGDRETGNTYIYIYTCPLNQKSNVKS